MRRAWWLIFGLCALPASPVRMQRIPAPLIPLPSARDRVTTVASAAPSQADQTPVERGSVGRAIGFGLLFGVAGFVGGALVGDAASEECDHAESICIAQAAFYGAAGGGTLGMATGVHLGNHRRGNVLIDFLAAAAVWGVGIAVAAGSEDESLRAAVLIAIPVVQLGTTVAVERATGAR